MFSMLLFPIATMASVAVCWTWIVHLFDRFIYYCVENGTDTKPTLYLRYMEPYAFVSSVCIFSHIDLEGGKWPNAAVTFTSHNTIHRTIHKDLLIIFCIFGCPFTILSHFVRICTFLCECTTHSHVIYPFQTLTLPVEKNRTFYSVVENFVFFLNMWKKYDLFSSISFLFLNNIESNLIIWTVCGMCSIVGTSFRCE